MYGDKFKEATKSLMSYCRENMGYDSDPDVHYVTDKGNANSMLGTTAHYQPESQTVTIYISNRHPKDALRSLAHELVHHAQNSRVDLQNVRTEEGYAQSDPHMRKMEEEAYLTGNMMFRDWEDTCKKNKTLNLNLPSTIGENKMSDQLNKIVAEKVIKELERQGIEIDEGLLDRLMAKGKGKLAGIGSRFRGAKDAFQGKGVEAGAPAAAETEAMFKSRIPKAAKQIDKIVSDLMGDLEELGLSKDERITNALSRLKGVQTSFNKTAAALIPAIKDAVEDEESPEQKEEEYDEDGKPRSFRFDPSAFNPLREDEEVEEAKKPDADGDGVPDWADKKPGKDDNDEKEIEETYGNPDRGGQASKRRYNPDQDASRDTYSSADRRKAAQKKKNNAKYKAAMRAQGLLEGKEVDKDMSKVPPQLRKHVAKKVQEKIQQHVEKILQEKADKKKSSPTVQDIKEVYKNPDRRGAGGQDIDSGIGKSVHGNMGEPHNKMVKAAKNQKELSKQFLAKDPGGKSPRARKMLINKYKKMGLKDIPSFDVRENELAEIKEGQDSIQNLNEQRNQRLNDELMRRLLK